MVGWHHQLDGDEFEQASGVGDEQGSLVCFPSHSRVLHVLMLSGLCRCQPASVLNIFLCKFFWVLATLGVLATTLPILCVFSNYIQIEVYSHLSLPVILWK